jgi:hypothetical protein
VRRHSESGLDSAQASQRGTRSRSWRASRSARARSRATPRRCGCSASRTNSVTARPRTPRFSHARTRRCTLLYVYAYDVLARVEAAAGRTQLALWYAHRAADTVPLPQFVTTLGDLYRATGRTREAREQYAVIGAIERILRSNGVRTELETVFDVDHGIRVREALARATGARRAAEHPGGRRARVGAGAERELRRSAALLEARPATRHAGRVELLPPRHDRALPRPFGGGADLGPAGARPEPALLARLGPTSRAGLPDPGLRGPLRRSSR